MRKLSLIFSLITLLSTTCFAAVNLVITGANVPNSMVAGNTYTVTYTVANIGTTSTNTSFYISLNISASSVYSSSATYLTDITVSGGLAANSSKTFTTTIFIPANYPPGVKYILAGVDATGLVNEAGGEGDNNYPLSVRIQGLADLKPLAFSLSQGSVSAGNTLTASFAVNNDGGAPAGNFDVGFYISSSETLNRSNSTFLGGYIVSSVPALGQTILLNKLLSIPASFCAGNYYIHIWVDDNQSTSESVTNNNFAHISLTVNGSGPSTPGTTFSNNNTSSGFQANWNPSSGAAGYIIDVSTSNSFFSLLNGYNNLNVGNTTSMPISGLNCNTTYYYRVRAYNNCGNTSGNSSFVTAFTTSCSCAAPIISANPINSSIVDGAGTLFSVNAFGGTAPYSYQWQVSTNGGSNWSAITTAGNNPSYANWTTPSLTLNGAVVSNNNYQYRCLVFSGSPCGSSFVTSNAATLSVNSAACNLPATPALAASDVQASSFTANFQTVPGNNSYYVDVATDIGFQTNLLAYTASSGSANIVGLNPETIYYYRVYYNNGTCNSSYSNAVQVTTTPFISNQPPVASFTIAGSNMINAGDAVQFTGMASPGPVTSWTWTFQQGTPASSTSQFPVIKYNTPGTYRVTLIACAGLLCSPAYVQTGFINVRPTNAKLAAMPPKAAIKSNGDQYLSPEPVQVGTGSYAYKHNDFNIPVIKGKLEFTRYYNSLNAGVDGPLGYGWSHSYNYRIDIQRDPLSQQDTIWNLQYADGHNAAFIPVFQGNGRSFPLYAGTLDSLQKNSGGDFTLYTNDNYRYHFTSLGQLDSVTDLNGNMVTLTYIGNNLVSITGPGGRTLNLVYNGTKIAKVTDPLNRACDFTYDSTGNLQSAKDAKGNPTNYSYNDQHQMLSIVNGLQNTLVANVYAANGRVISQSDAYGKTTGFNYDTPGKGDATITNPDNSQLVVHHDSLYRKTNISDEMAFTQSFSYDMNSQVTAYTNQNGVTEARTFDQRGNLLSKSLPGGITSSIAYNLLNSPVQLTDPNGNTALLTYDVANTPLSIHLPDNTDQSFTSYGNGLRQTVKDGRGNTTTFSYTPDGDLSTSATSSATKYFTHDAAGRLTTVTDENGSVSKISYDDNDNITAMVNGLNKAINFTYDANNQLVSLTDRSGSVTNFAYDKKGRLINRTNPNQGVTTYTYDVMDNLSSVTDPNGHTVSFGYDKTRHKTSMTNAAGKTQYQYNGVGNLLKITDATGKTTSYTYSITGKIRTMSDGLSNTSNFTYDLNDNLVRVANPLNKATAYSYDAMNRLIAVLDAAGNTTKITYDQNGNKKILTDPNGHSQTFTYDAANRLTSLQDAGGNNYSFGYDAAGNNTNINKPTGSITKVHDAANRVVSVTNSTGNSYNFTYDDNDNIIVMSSNAGATYMTYDKLNQLTQYTDPFNNRVIFGYDPSGNKSAVTYPGNKVVNYSYDNSNNLTAVKDWLGHTFKYTYDAAGSPVQLLYPNGVHCDFAFDSGSRLTSKKTASGSNTIITASVFTLDALGNRITEQRTGPTPSNLVPASKVYTYTNDDEMQKDSVWTFANDNSGNRLSEAKGNIKANYTFSADNRLDAFVDTAGKISTYTYDPMGNRLSKSAGNIANRFVLDIVNGPSKILQITDGNNAISSQYIYGTGLLERIDSAGNVLYYHYDAQHNTIAITDANAVVKDSYTYDPFGVLLSHQGNTDQPFTFLGDFGVERENTSLYFDRARYYDAANGRFLSKDALSGIAINPQSMNSYVYSMNSPVANYDDSGYYGNSDWIEYAGHLGDALKFLNAVKLDKEVIPYWGGFLETLKAETSSFHMNQDIGLGAVEIVDVIDYTKKLHNLYDEDQKIIDDYIDNKTSYGTAWRQLMLSIGKVLPVTSNLITYRTDLKQTVDDYMDYKINGAQLWNGIFVSTVNTIIPGYKDLINNMGDIYGSTIYQLFNK